MRTASYGLLLQCSAVYLRLLITIRQRPARRLHSTTQRTAVFLLLTYCYSAARVGGVDHTAGNGGGPESILICSDQKSGLAARVVFTSAYAHVPLHYSAQDFSSGLNVDSADHKGIAGVPHGGWMDVIDYLSVLVVDACLTQNPALPLSGRFSYTHLRN